MTIDQALESYTRGILESGGWNFEHDLNDRERLALLAVGDALWRLQREHNLATGREKYNANLDDVKIRHN